MNEEEFIEKTARLLVKVRKAAVEGTELTLTADEVGDLIVLLKAIAA